MTGFIDIWVTCPDRDVAGKIAKATLSERLVACANIFGTVSSIYHWKGAIESEEEVPLLLKTRAEHFDAVNLLHHERLHVYCEGHQWLQKLVVGAEPAIPCCARLLHPNPEGSVPLVVNEARAV